MIRYRKTGRMLLLLGFSALYLLSTGIVANLLIRPLEKNYPPLRGAIKADAIVILTAGIRDLSHTGIGFFPDTQSLERLVEGYRIYRGSKGLVPVIISGGRADPSKPDISIGGTSGKTALAFGIPERDLLIEDESVNTYEGALRVRDILGSGKKVILVTSASHMPRSAKLYKKAGFDVVPAPTYFLGSPVSLSIYSFIPTAGSLCTSSTAFYEYASTLWYMLKGTF